MSNTTTQTEFVESIGGHVIDFSDAALSVLPWSSRGTVGIVRRTLRGEFVVIELLGGGRKRLAKVLPSVERARAYNFACAR